MMQLKNKLQYLAIGGSLLILTACGGSEGSASDAQKTASLESKVDNLIGTVTYMYSGGFARGFFKDSDDYLYDASGCRLNLISTNKVNKVYSDGGITTNYTFKGVEYTSRCNLTDVYRKINVSNTLISAPYMGIKGTADLFYNSSTRYIYEVEGVNLNPDSGVKISEVFNDGMNVVLQYPSGTQIEAKLESIYQKIDPSVVGITKYEPKAPFFSTNSDVLMETGYTNSVSDKPYNIRAGYLYKYEQSGCDTGNIFGGVYYSIFNDGSMLTINDDGSVSACNIARYFEEIGPVNSTSVYARYVDYGLFYDSNSKVFYQIEGLNTSSGYFISEIVNDGNTAIIDNGKGTLAIALITEAYREVNP